MRRLVLSRDFALASEGILHGRCQCAQAEKETRGSQAGGGRHREAQLRDFLARGPVRRAVPLRPAVLRVSRPLASRLAGLCLLAG